jgi:hypothetical protein
VSPPSATLAPAPSAAPENRRTRGGGLTLDERLSGVWEGLLAAGFADCPLCDGRMERAGESGRCTSCGTRLA